MADPRLSAFNDPDMVRLSDAIARGRNFDPAANPGRLPPARLGNPELPFYTQGSSVNTAAGRVNASPNAPTYVPPPSPNAPPNMAGAVDRVTAPPQARMSPYAADTLRGARSSGIFNGVTPEQGNAFVRQLPNLVGTEAIDNAYARLENTAAANRAPLPASRAPAIGQQNFQFRGGPTSGASTYDGMPRFGVPSVVSPPATETAAQAVRASSPFMDDLGAVARGFNGAVEGLGRGVGRVMSSPVVNNPLTRTVGRIAAPIGAAIGAYNTVDELMDPNSAPRQRFSTFNQNLDAGNVGTAAKNAYYGIGDMVGTFTGLKPLARMLAGADRPAPIAMDKNGDFSRAPTNKAEYDEMMQMKYGPSRQQAGAEGSAESPFPAQQPARSEMPTMRQAVVGARPRESAEAYASRAQAEIDRRRPEREASNREIAERYALSHPAERGQDKVLGNLGHLLQGTGSLEHARAQAQELPKQTAISLRNAMANERQAEAQMKTAERPVIDRRSPVDLANTQLFDAYKAAAQKRKQDMLRANPNADTSAVDAELLNIRDRIFGKHTFSTDEVMKGLMPRVQPEVD